MVILWIPSDKPQTGFGESSSDVVDKEFWRVQRVLQYVPKSALMLKLISRVTGKHVYDLAWSPDSEFLIAGATDNTASIWKAGTGKLPLP
jgi:chromatin assembly factor 1 subunit B